MTMCAVVGIFVMNALLGDLGCELRPGTSIYGDRSWSWFPPGGVCEWDAFQAPPDGDHQEPSLLRLPAIGVLGTVPVMLIRSRRRDRAAEQTTATAHANGS